MRTPEQVNLPLDDRAHTAATSRAAAEPSSARETQRAHVFETIARAGAHGATDDEIQLTLGLDGSSERPRRFELAKCGAIRVRCDADGKPITRLTRTNHRAVVWIAAEVA